MKWITIVFAICTLNLIYAKVPNGYVDPSNIKKYDRGRYSSFNHREDEERCLEIQRIDCECDNKDCKHHEEDVLFLHTYHKRLINSLLNSLQVIDSKYVLKLNTEIMEDQLQFLKRYGQSKELDYDTLRQVDDLMSDILYQAQSTSLYDSVDWKQHIKLLLTTQNIIIIAITAVVYMTYRLIHIRFSIIRAIGLFIFIFLIIGFGWTWHDLVEEEEIKLMAERMQYPIPPECNAAERTWWQNLFPSKTEVDCQKFVRAHNKKATLSITPQKVFSEMFGQSISHLLGHFINSMVEFITKMHESLPFPFNYLSLPFLLIFVLLMIVLLVIILSGVRLKLGLFNIFHVEIGGRDRDRDRNHREYLQQIPQQAQLVNVNDGSAIQNQQRGGHQLEANVSGHIQQRGRLEPVNQPQLEANINDQEVECQEIQQRESENGTEFQRIETKKSKDNGSENSGTTMLTRNESVSSQTELINTTSQSQQTSNNYEINKVENISCKDVVDKSHGDDTLTNSFDFKETSNNKLEMGSGDSPL